MGQHHFSPTINKLAQKKGTKNMARQPQITRTIQSTKAKLMCLNISTGTPETKEINLARTYKNEQSILKEAKKKLDTDEIKVVHVTEYETQHKRYGMSEQCFIENAEELEPIVRRPKTVAPENTVEI